MRRHELARALVAVLQLLLLFSAAEAMRSQTWFEADFSLKFTDGVPDGTTLNITASVDEDGSHQKVDLFGVLRLLRWQEERDPSAVVPGTENDTDGTFGMALPGPKDLDTHRTTSWRMLWLCMASSLLLGLITLRPERRAWQRWLGAAHVGLFSSFVVLLVLGTPLAWVSTLDVDARLEDPDSEGDWFIHAEQESEVDVGLSGVSVDFRASGFDLGLIAAENRSTALRESPTQNDPSYISWEGQAGWRVPIWQQDLIVLGTLVWFALPMLLGVFSRSAIDKPHALVMYSALEEE